MQKRIVMNVLGKGASLSLHKGMTGKKGLAKRSFFATMKENCMAADARVLEESRQKERVFGASFWSFLAKHSWG